MLSVGIAALARRRAALTVSGAWAAAITGLVLTAAGWNWLALVGVFFITSSILTRLEPPSVGRLEGSAAGVRRSNDLGGRRWQQVTANGGVATLAAAIYAMTGWPQGFGVAAGAVAAATADTWATEIGRWSTTPPRLITTGTPVAPGRSGGITLIGTLASAAGALVIALTASALGGLPHSPGDAGAAHRAAAWIAVAGFSGSLLDSVLGATVENRRRWLSNDAVNVAMTAWGAAMMLVTAVL